MNKARILEEINYPDSITGAAISKTGEIVKCIAYDTTAKNVKEAVLMSMIYNNWTENGQKVSAYSYPHPKAIKEAFTFVVLETTEQKEEFKKAHGLI